MSTPFEDVANLDRLVHDPSRLAILTTLDACATADFTFLQAATGLTKGNLSAHMAKLEEAGLVIVTKSFIEKRPNTAFALTAAGTKAVGQHWQRLEDLRKQTKQWRKKK